MLAVIVCGGYGSRLWPLSRRALPKQFADLGFEHSLFQQTLLRLKDHPLLDENPLIIANEQHRFLLLQQLQDIGVEPVDIILEPCGRNTAAAICLAALWQQKSNLADTPMLIMPSDHLIDYVQPFHQAITRAHTLAMQGLLAVFGVVPDYEETGYGYIQPGEPVDSGYSVKAFKEKPDVETARLYLNEGGHYWNSGMFAFTGTAYLNELKKHRHVLMENCNKAWKAATRKWEFIFPNEQSFAEVEDVSVDYAVMEHTDKAAMVVLDAGWNDLGSWKTVLSKQGSKLPDDQLTVAVKSTGCHVKSSGRKTIGLVDIHDLLVVDTQDALLIASSRSSQDVGALVTQLEQKRPEAVERHVLTYRAWGWHKVLARAENYQINQMEIKLGRRLSFRKHQYHSEHWTVISGIANICYEGQSKTIHEHESYFIPAGLVYSLVNVGNTLLNIIEVQIGNDGDFDHDLVRLQHD